MTENENFMLRQQQAVEKMMEMNRRSIEGNSYNMPPSPHFVKLPKKEAQNTQQNTKVPKDEKKTEGSNMLGVSLPFLEKFKTDRDATLIIGLLLILYSEKSDRFLLLALLYILL